MGLLLGVGAHMQELRRVRYDIPKSFSLGRFRISTVRYLASYVVTLRKALTPNVEQIRSNG